VVTRAGRIGKERIASSKGGRIIETRVD